MNNNQIIEKIHTEFKTSIDNEVETVMSAKKNLKKIKNEFSDIESNYLRLSKLGISSKQTKTILSKKKVKKDLSKNISELEDHLNFISEISQHGYKVIGYKQIDKILKKWNLYISNALNYEGDIPTETSEKILKFQDSEIQKVRFLSSELHLPILNKSKSVKSNAKLEHYTNSNFYIIANLKDFKSSTRKLKQTFIGNEIIYLPGLNLKFPKIQKQYPDPVVLHPAGNSPAGEPYFYIIDLWGPEANIPDFSSDNV